MKIAFNLKIKDVDCDFRLMHRKIFDNITLESDSGMICIEMMKKIGDAGFTIKDVPVTHYDRIQGKSQFFKLSRVLKTFKGLIKAWITLVLLKKDGKRADKSKADIPE